MALNSFNRKDLSVDEQGSSLHIGDDSRRVTEDRMWIRLENWQTEQLQRLATGDPERAETILNTLWNACPGLLGELAITAVDQESLSINACADLLGISSEEVERRLVAYRRHSITVDRAVVQEGACNGARLAEGQVAVWEVIREYRKLGSVSRLRESFPSLSEAELAAAFIYAEENPAEIEERICRYESMLAQKRLKYPFVSG